MLVGDDLASAAATGNTELLNILLQNGTDANGLNRFGRTPVQVMMMGSSSVAQLLLEYGANPNVSDCHTCATPLHDAARLGFLDTVKILVKYNAEINAIDNQDQRPVDLAKRNEHWDVAAFLESL